MDFQAFLSGLVAGSAEEVAAVAVTVALFVFGIIEFVDKKVRPLASNTKFWAALILSFVVPLGAYAGYQAMWGGVIELNGLFLACATGYAASQVVHKATDIITQKNKAQGAVQERLEAYTTDYIPVEPGKTYTFPSSKDGAVFYDKDKQPTGVVVPLGHMPYIAPITPIQGQSYEEDTDLSNSGDVTDERGPSGGM